ncbi:MAG: hypothetical protein H7067_16160 [Burkholderiales bacterium]|nr:hypothetical protein [Opitutaceae bacterium]
MSVSPDGTCHFFHADASAESVEMARPFVAHGGGWMDAQVGLFAAGDAGHADFSTFVFSQPLRSP